MRAWFSTVRLLVGLGWEIGARVFVLYTLVTMSTFISPLLMAFGVRPLVDGVVYGDPRRVTTGGIAVGVALLLILTAPIGYRWATVRMRERSSLVTERRVLALAMRAPEIHHFERAEFLDRLQTLRREAEELASSVTLPFVAPVVTAQLAVTTLLLADLRLLLGVVPLVALPALWLSRRAESIRRRAEQESAPERRLSQQLFALAVSAGSAQELHTAEIGDELARRHHDASVKADRRVHTALFRAVAVGGVGWALLPIAYLAALLLVLREAVAGQATPGDVALALALASAAVAAANRVLDLAGSVLRVRTTAGHYFWLSDQAQSRESKATMPRSLERGIELEQVTFSYGDGDRLALARTDLFLPAGKTIALVGENGAGKTTVVKLLTGMYRPSSGRVLVDGVDLSTLNLEAYRRRLSAGFQDFVRYQLTVRDAVAVGGLEEDRSRVEAALAKADAGFVDLLPAGADTQLGSAWSDGVELSGGQWQKLAMARAFMRPAPLLVIMDEPSASLDPQSEHQLFDRLTAEARSGQEHGRITLLISHRFSTVRAADLIIVLERGVVTEQGSHEELIALGGTYAELYELQAAGYR